MDVRTMAVMGAVVAVLLAVVLFAQYRLNRSYPGMGWWAAGQASLAAGFVVSMLRGESLAGRLAVPAYQALLVLGAILILVGVLRFVGRRERRGWLVAAWVLLVAWSAFHTFAVDDARLRSIGLYLMLGLVIGITGTVLWRQRRGSIRGSATLLAVVFLGTATGYAILAVAEWGRSPEADPFFASSPVNAAAFLLAVTSMLLWSFGLVIMINQRLAGDLAIEARNMRSIFATGPDCAVISRLEDGAIEDVNAGFTALTGYERDEAIGRSSLDLELWAQPFVRESLVRDVAVTGSLSDFPMAMRRKDGTTVDCLIAASMLTLDDEPYLITVIRDVTQQRRLEAELLHEATTDSLTDLPNRRHFLPLLNREVRRAGRGGGTVAVALLDIDHFKEINDTYGHATGDAAVVAFAGAVRAGLRDIDTLGRLGGDEFGVVLPDATAESALVALDRVRATLAAHPVVVDGQPLAITFSAGVAGRVDDDDTVDSLLARADIALYRAKEGGRNRVAVQEVTGPGAPAS